MVFQIFKNLITDNEIEIKEIRSEYTAYLKKAYDHCIARGGLWAAISQEPLVKLLQWYNEVFLVQKVRVLTLSEILAPFDLNKRTTTGRYTVPYGRIPMALHSCSGKPVWLLWSF